MQVWIYMRYAFSLCVYASVCIIHVLCLTFTVRDYEYDYKTTTNFCNEFLEKLNITFCI